MCATNPTEGSQHLKACARRCHNLCNYDVNLFEITYHIEWSAVNKIILEEKFGNRASKLSYLLCYCLPNNTYLISVVSTHCKFRLDIGAQVRE